MENIKQSAQHSSFQNHGRTAYFIDIDNLCGSGVAPKQMVEISVGAIRARYRPQSTDLVFCAATAIAAYHCKAAWPGCSVRIGRGPNGADLQLLNDAKPEWLAARFDRVVIASGDGIFAPLAEDLIKTGLKVEFAVGSGGVSRKILQIGPVVRLPISQPKAWAA